MIRSTSSSELEGLLKCAIEGLSQVMYRDHLPKGRREGTYLSSTEKASAFTHQSRTDEAVQY